VWLRPRSLGTFLFVFNRYLPLISVTLVYVGACTHNEIIYIIQQLSLVVGLKTYLSAAVRILVFGLPLPTKIIKYRDANIYTPQLYVRTHPKILIYLFPFIFSSCRAPPLWNSCRARYARISCATHLTNLFSSHSVPPNDCSLGTKSLDIVVAWGFIHGGSFTWPWAVIDQLHNDSLAFYRPSCSRRFTPIAFAVRLGNQHAASF